MKALASLRQVLGRASRRCLSQYNPASAFAPVSESMLISLSMQYAIGGACSHAELTHRLKSAGLLRSDSVTAAFSSVDRAAFVPEDVTDPAVIYDNRFIRCGSFGSLCAPSMQVTVLELFQHLLGPGRRALDIGTGTGAMAVLFAEIGADVDAIDLDANAISSASLRHPHRSIRWKQEDAYQLDAADADSYDCIHVGACIEFVPETWLDLLRVGGMMVVPIGRADSEQTLMKLCKTADLLDGRHIIQRKAVQACKYEAMRSGSEDEGGKSDRQLLKADVQQELRGWYEAFESRHGRKPNLADIKSDALMAKLLSRYRQQSRL